MVQNNSQVLVIDRLNDSDPILRIRALQAICNEYRKFVGFHPSIIKLLVSQLNKERHPKVIRWLSYTLANIRGGHIALQAITQKMKQVSDNDVLEWLIASKVKIEIELSNQKIIYPIELYSQQDLLTGVIKSWPYRKIDKEILSILTKALNHSDPSIRKWAALSIGNKKISLPYVKDAIKNCFDDDNYLVREWSMYALKDVATEEDFKAYTIRLEKEPHIRVREWAVKSLPYTESREVPLLLLNELHNNSYLEDPLYAEAVITALSKYVDRNDVRHKLINIIRESNDDIILLSATTSLESYLKENLNNEEIVNILYEAHKQARSDSVKKQIGCLILESFEPSEKEYISSLIQNKKNKSALKAIFSYDRDSILEELLINHDKEYYGNCIKSQKHLKQRQSRVNVKGVNMNIDVGIICALQYPELDYFKKVNNECLKWSEYPIAKEHHLYWKTNITSKTGRLISLIASSPTKMGPIASTILTTKMILHFRPQFIIMVGIAAGTMKPGRNYGDILVADPSIDYQSGKILIDSQGNELFQPDYYPIPLNARITNILNKLQADGTHLDEIRRKFRGNKPETTLNIHIGPLGSGTMVVDSIKPIEEIQKHWRKLIGVEMETYGVYRACKESGEPQPQVISFKSVCDFACDKKNDWQEYAAFVSAEYAYRFIVNDLGF